MCAAMTAVFLVSSAAPGGSIWQKCRANPAVSRSLTSNDTARGVGDVLTIDIQEKATIETKKGQTMSKSNSTSGQMSGTFDLGHLLPGLNSAALPKILQTGTTFQLPNADYSGQSASGFTGSTDHKDEQSFTDLITVVVEDVMPNGSLLVLGKRIREVAGNKQIIQVSGIVRPADIAADNVVKSDRVANFHIVFNNRGQENNFLRPGWLMRIWNLVNPF